MKRIVPAKYIFVLSILCFGLLQSNAQNINDYKLTKHKFPVEKQYLPGVQGTGYKYIPYQNRNKNTNRDVNINATYVGTIPTDARTAMTNGVFPILSNIFNKLILIFIILHSISVYIRLLSYFSRILLFIVNFLLSLIMLSFEFLSNYYLHDNLLIFENNPLL